MLILKIQIWISLKNTLADIFCDGSQTFSGAEYRYLVLTSREQIRLD